MAYFNFLLLVSLLFLPAHLTSNPASWISRSDVQSNSFLILDVANSISSNPHTLTFTNTFGMVPTTAFGIIAFEYPGSTTFSFSCVGENPTFSSVDFTCTIDSGTTINYLKVSALTIGAMVMGVQVLHDAKTFSVLSTGTGTRTESFTGTMTGVNAEYDVKFAAFLIGWELALESMQQYDFKLQISQDPVTTSQYQILFTAGPGNTLTTSSYYTLLLDLPSLYPSSTADLILGSYSLSASTTDPYLLLPINVSGSFMAGLNDFSFDSSDPPQFTLDLATLNLTVVGANSRVGMAAVQYRMWQCLGGVANYIVFEEDVCYDVCPAGYYLDGSNMVCRKCYKTCGNCSGGSVTDCTSCVVSQKRTLQGNLCVCSDAGVYQANADTCFDCSVTCQSCLTSDTNCQSCAPNTHRTFSSNTCPCDSGFVDNNTAICVACNEFIEGCLTCSSQSVCESCDVSGHWSLSGGVCGCALKYYRSGPGVCQACELSCKTCSGNAANCTMCPAGAHRTLDTTDSAAQTCPCDQYYAENGMESCAACSALIPGCTECSSSTVCTVCDTANNWQKTGDICTCLAKHFISGPICSPCDHQCQQCSTISSNCTSCPLSSHRTLTSNTCPCDSTYYDSGTATCQSCSSSIDGCAICTSGPTCQFCHTNFSPNGNLCECSLGYYHSAANTCTACSYQCQNCDVTNTNCTSCPAGSHRTLQGQTCACDVGFVDNGVTVCVGCGVVMKGCEECTTVTVCTVCDAANGFSLNVGDDKCHCATHQFVSGSGPYVCASCSITCQQCDTISTNCTSCPASSHRTLTSNTCPCDPGYTSDGTATCPSCSSTMPGCQQCSNLATCTLCDTAGNFQLLGDDKCHCLSHYYLSGGVCSQCAISCLECDTVATNCTSCPSASHRTLAGEACPCDTGFGDDGTAICISCNTNMAGCQQCSSSTVCTLCDTNKGFTLDGNDNQCHCPTHQYSDNTQTCAQCSITCQQCSLLSTNCTSCPASSHRTLTSNTCPCDTGYTDDGTAQCKACTTTMTGCSECSSLSVCTVCDAGNNFVLDAGDNTCDCLAKHYLTNTNICAQCSVTCQQCSVLATNCTSCPSAAHRTLTGQACPCDTGYGDDGTAECKACGTTMVGCLQCSSSTVCTLCDTAKGFTLDGNDNQCHCPSHQYSDNTVTCTACSFTCQQCSILSTNCTSCPASSHRTLTSNTCPCDTGYTDDGTVQCKACTSTMTGCSECSSLTVCTMCDAGNNFTLDAGDNKCDCLAKHYLTNTNVCAQCSVTCQQCSVLATNCTSCPSASHRTLTGQACPCDTGFGDDGTAICIACNTNMPGCQQCSSSTVCTLCDTSKGFTLDGNDNQCHCAAHQYVDNTGACAACSITCQACSILPTNCTSCPSSSHRTLTSEACPCDTGYTDDGTAECKACASTMKGCQQCSSLTVCTVCDTGNNFVLDAGDNKCDCLAKHYLTNTDICAQCSVTCQQCSVLATNCTSCPSAAHRTLTGQACPCDTGFGDDGTAECKACDITMIGCTECSTVSICTVCDTNKGFLLNASNIQCYCPAHHYIDNTNTCLICSITCQQCSILSTNCTSCLLSSHRALTSQTCPCDTGYTDDGTAQCKACSSTMKGCQQCTSLTVCTVCDTANNFTLDAGDNKCDCLAKHYVNNLDVCAQCSVTCQQCSVLATNCTSCPSASHRTLTGQACPCDTGFGDDGTAICLACHTNMMGCQQCSTSTTCTVCDTNKGFLLNATTHQCYCPLHHYIDNTDTCLICDISCQQCSILSTNCSSCPASSHRTLTSQTCPCDTGFADDGTAICKACSTTMKGCQECSSLTVCTVCDTANNFTLDVGDNKCDCLAKHYVNNLDVCAQCSVACQQCSVLATNCTSCPTASHRTLTGQACPCDTGFGDDGTAECKACDITMIGCTECSTVAICTVCDTNKGFLLNASNSQCYCPTNYHLTATNTCSQCSITCQQCDTISTNCTSCPLSSFRTLTSNTCPCDTGHTQNASAICPACSTTMKGCQQCNDLTTCTVCDTAGNFELLGDNKCHCVSQYYLSAMFVCEACAVSCEECSTVSTNCTSCPSGSQRTLTGEACPCDTGFGEDGTAVCKVCNTNLVGCMQCAVITACTVCDTANNFTLNATDNKCNCLTNHYLTNTNICAQCSITCQQCHTLPTNCTSCPASSFRTLTSNTCPCDYGYVSDSTPICKPCSTMPGCLNCSSLSICTTCHTVGNFLLNNTGDNQCYCLSHYYLTATNTCSLCDVSCQECHTVSTNCTSCPAASNRTQTGEACPCDTGYGEDGTAICKACNTNLVGCLQCAMITACTVCDVANNFTLNATDNKCNCLTNHYLTNTNVCAQCSITCQQCSTVSTNCTSCPVSSFRTLTSNTCPCDSHYIHDGTAICKNCNTNIKGCLFCSDLNTCTTCDTANNFSLNAGDNQCYCLARHYLTNLDVCGACSYTCEECSTVGTNCTSCVSGSFRTLAVDKCPCDTGYADNGTETCVTCGSVLTGCLQCTSNTVCTLCDTPNFFSLSSGTCLCNTGYYLNSTSCQTCNTTLSKFCTSCTSSTACTQCTSPWTISSGLCICPTGYLVIASGDCSVCSFLCGSCDLNGCLTCITGYQIVNVSKCEEICGDGKVFVLQCDDGNTEDGDGCSKQCKIQEGFKCVNGTMTTPSVCSYNGSLTFILERIVKEATANRVDFFILVRPVLKVLRTWNFSQVVNIRIQRKKTSRTTSTTTPTVSATTPTQPAEITTTITYSQSGTLLAQVSYSESIQDLSATVSFTPPTTSSSFAMQSSSVAFTVDPQNLDAYYITPTTYQLVSGTEMVYKGTLGIAMVMTIISLFVAPVLGLEMMNVLQMGFFAVGMLGEVQPVLATIGELYPVVNGYNRLFDTVEDQFEMNGVSLTKMMNQIRAGPRFWMNFNYMLFVEVFLVGVMVLFVYLKTRFKDNNGLGISTKVITSFTIAFIAFNSLNLGFSIGMEFAFISQPSYNAPRVVLNILGWVIGGSIQILCCIFLRKHPQLLQFPNQKALKASINISTYLIVFTSYRSILGLIMGGFHLLQPSALLLSIQIILLIYLLYLRPYTHWFLNIRMALNQLAVCLIFISTTIYTYVLTGERVSEQGPVIAQTVLVVLAVAVGAIAVGWVMFKKERRVGDIQRRVKEEKDVVVVLDKEKELEEKPEKVEIVEEPSRIQLNLNEPSVPVADSSNVQLIPETSGRNPQMDQTMATIQVEDQLVPDVPKVRKPKLPKKLKKISLAEEVDL